MVTLHLAEALGRELTADEHEMVEFISPQGAAKLNSDICKGVNLEQTLVEMRSVYQTMRKRRQLVQSALPETAQSILARLNRPPTTDEMVLLADIPSTVLLGKINTHLGLGEELEDILDDLAVEHRQKQLLFDAQRLANDKGMAVSISRLAPTTPPAPSASKGDDQLILTNSATYKANKIRLGLSPIATWFDEKPRTPQSPTVIGSVASTPSVVCANSPTGTPRSALKHGGCSRRFPTMSSFHSETNLDEAGTTTIGASPSQHNGGGEILVRALTVSFSLEHGLTDDSENGTPERPRSSSRRAASQSPNKQRRSIASCVGSSSSGNLGSHPSTTTNNPLATSSSSSPRGRNPNWGGLSGSILVGSASSPSLALSATSALDSSPPPASSASLPNSPSFANKIARFKVGLTKLLSPKRKSIAPFPN